MWIKTKKAQHPGAKDCLSIKKNLVIIISVLGLLLSMLRSALIKNEMNKRKKEKRKSYISRETSLQKYER